MAAAVTFWPAELHPRLSCWGLPKERAKGSKSTPQKSKTAILKPTLISNFCYTLRIWKLQRGEGEKAGG